MSSYVLYIFIMYVPSSKHSEACRYLILYIPASTYIGAANEGLCFLECSEGWEWQKVFRGVRLQHILNDVVSVRTVEADMIIPQCE